MVFGLGGYPPEVNKLLKPSMMVVQIYRLLHFDCHVLDLWYKTRGRGSAMYFCQLLTKIVRGQCKLGGGLRGIRGVKPHNPPPTPDKSSMEPIMTSSQSCMKPIMTSSQSCMGKIVTSSQPCIGPIMASFQSCMGPIMTSFQF